VFKREPWPSNADIGSPALIRAAYVLNTSVRTLMLANLTWTITNASGLKMVFIRKVYNFGLGEKSILICIPKQNYVRITKVISLYLSNYLKKKQPQRKEYSFSFI
jgi:hypothetical protein